MKKKKTLYILLSVLLGVLLVLEGVPYFVNVYLNANADRLVSDMITRTNDFSGHKVKIGNIRLDYDYRGTYLELDSVAIYPEEQVEENKVRIDLMADRILISGFRWRSLVFDNAIVLDSAQLKGLYIQSTSPSLDSLQLKEDSTSSRKKGKDYKSIKVNHINVQNLNLENRDMATDSLRLEIAGLNLNAGEFELTSEDLANDQALFGVGDIEGSIAKAAVHFNESRNVVVAKGMTIDKANKSLKIDSVGLDNKWDKYRYINDFTKETDWIELERGQLELINMNYEAFLAKGLIEAETLHAKDLKISVFRDKRKPDDTRKRPKMINEIINSIPKDLHLDKIHMENGHVSYEERPDNGVPKSGMIFFDQINADISNITNIPELLEDHSELTLKANARIMGAGKVDLNVTYFLQDSTGKFKMDGMIHSMELPEINAMLRPATQVEIRSGQLQSLAFNINGNDLEGRGELIMKYTNLAIDIRGKSYGKDQNVFQKIGSFLTNKLIIRTENPNKKEELRKGHVYFKRDQSKFIFNYWWKMMLSGMRSTLTGEDEETLRKRTE
ncbi:hypothetical protein GCM10007049_10320 [Echinicola pacifica]|uniref:DUF748 domain-containing protein n=1 Tax=Echinicola pacifica TaxID=346377 RepID=A0A918PSI2_9BACT|nr:DUF748 domain-containing protein [Echinicola pacifica]GGZ19731.1 hypothetical protein GCM10007049_10320 [Echinicola pacifica]